MTAHDLDVILHTQNFSHPARSLEGVIDSLVASGSLACGSADATALANAVHEVLGVQI